MRRAGVALGILGGAGAFLLLLAFLGVGAAFLGGPALVELARALSGR